MKGINEVLFRVATQRERRIDNLLDRMSGNDARPEDLRDLRELITSEIKASQRLRSVAVIATIFIAVLASGSGLWAQHQEQLHDQALEYYQTSNLPVIFQNADNGDLRIRFSDDEGAPEKVRSDIRAINRNEAGFGRHPGLGEGRELDVSFDPGFNDGLRYIFRPDNDSTTIGQMTLTRRSGILDPQVQAIVPGGPPRAFYQLRDFALRIDAFDEVNREWSVRFCERTPSAGDFECTTREYAVGKSKAGRQQEHFLVKEPAWSSVYFVSIGFGEQGEEGRVWTVNANATKLGLLN